LKNFEDFGLIEPLMRALVSTGYDTATPIQQIAIPPVLEGYDLMGCAQTGTGKTAAFALPTLQRLALSAPVKENVPPPPRSARPGNERSAPRPIRGLVLAPTRELAAQIEQSFVTYGKYLNLRIAVVHGGVSQMPQVRSLQRGVDILIATPGRLLDLMNQQVADISRIEVLVIDEADQMFDMGFLRDLKRIVARVPLDRQTLMFSATMPEPIRELADQWLYEPKYVKVAKVSSASVQVSQSVFHVSVPNKPKLLTQYLRSSGVTRSIVFTRTKHGADDLVKVLMKNGIEAVAIHGNKSQNARTRHLEQFKSNRPPILVATDIAARGIDVQGISHVINYQLPEVPEIYVHRIGRTGRAEATGIAVSFCSSEERSNLRDIERLLDTTIEVNQAFPEFTQPAKSNESGLRGSRSGANNERLSGRTRSSGGRSSSSSSRGRRTRVASRA
jgi:ATP-dependent RNA helicase RhlE